MMNSVADVGRAIRRCAPDAVFVVCDEHTAAECWHVIEEEVVRWEGFAEPSPYHLITIPAGEAHKDIATLQHLWQTFSDQGASRRSLVVNLGGGMVCDIGGFAAATFKRGISVVNVPTTLLAMIDAAEGGKTAVNFNGIKNEIGAFHAPQAVVVLPSFLHSLPYDELLSGYGEMLKHALLADERHWAEVIRMESDIISTPSLDSLIERSRQVKLDTVEKDPYENGIRQSLNLGHTLGHALEASYDLLHGHAVAHGLAADLYQSVALCGFPTDKMRQTVGHIRECYGRPPIACKDYEMLYERMMHDKKCHHNRLYTTLLKDIGCPVIDLPLTSEDVFEALDFLREG